MMKYSIVLAVATVAFLGVHAAALPVRANSLMMPVEQQSIANAQVASDNAQLSCRTFTDAIAHFIDDAANTGGQSIQRTRKEASESLHSTGSNDPLDDVFKLARQKVLLKFNASADKKQKQMQASLVAPSAAIDEPFKVARQRVLMRLSNAQAPRVRFVGKPNAFRSTPPLSKGTTHPRSFKRARQPFEDASSSINIAHDESPLALLAEAAHETSAKRARTEPRAVTSVDSFDAGSRTSSPRAVF